jgi:hypothetical protein
MHKPFKHLLVAAGASLVAVPALADAVADRIAELERQLAELKAEVASNRASISTQADEIEAVRPVTGGTSFRYGGYVQLDAISSRYSEGKPSNSLIDDFIVPSLIPVEPASGESDSHSNFKLHAKSSRFFFATSTPTAAGDVSTRFELDFILSPGGDERISHSWNARMRHAYVNWAYDEGSSVLAGQTWSTFFNVGALPDLLDFVGPVGTVFNRQPMIRWTSGGLQLALENSATRLNQYDAGTLGTRLDDAETLPDLVARYNGKVGDLGWSIAALGRQLTYEARAGDSIEVDSDERFAYGLSLAGKWMLGRDDMRFMVTYGDGLGRYMGLNAFNDGYINARGEIETIDQLGVLLAFQHYWSDHWHSTFSVSMAEADNPGVNEFAGAADLARAYQTLHANLMWIAAPNLQFGGELSYASKELESGRDGDFNRLQLAVKYAF